jgi:hypothetical protein
MYSIASWDPTQSGFYEWLEARLVNDHPALRETEPGGRTWARKLIEEDVLLPVLDGFDELPAELRGVARDGLNDALRRGAGLVLSCRTADYSAVVLTNHGSNGRLQATAAVHIEALNLREAQRYLEADIDDGERWARVFDAARPNAALAAMFRAPLYVGLARTIYNPRPGEPLDRLPDPAELTDTARFPDQEAIQTHLFRGFLPAAYRQFPGQRRRPMCSDERAAHWLAFLAAWMDGRRAGGASDQPTKPRPVVDLAWWELRDAAGVPVIGLFSGLLPAVAVGIVAAVDGTLGMGLGVGVIAALGVVFFTPRVSGIRTAVRTPERFMALAGPPRPSIVGGMAGGFVGGFVGGVLGGLVGHTLRGTPPTAGIMGGLGAGIGAGAIGGPRRGFLGGLAGGFAVGLTAGMGAGVAAGVVDGIAAWIAAGATVALTGLRRPARDVRALHYSKVGLIVGLTVALAIGAQVAFRHGLGTGVIAGLIVGVLGGLAAGLEGTTVDPTRMAGPRSTLQRDRGTFFMVGILGGLAFGIGAGFGVQPAVGVAAGLTVGLVAASVQSSYGAFVIARFWLAARRRLPWQFMTFLADAHRLGVLRQIGAVYQFRHLELQRHLALLRPSDVNQAGGVSS